MPFFNCCKSTSAVNTHSVHQQAPTQSTGQAANPPSGLARAVHDIASQPELVPSAAISQPSAQVLGSVAASASLAGSNEVVQEDDVAHPVGENESSSEWGQHLSLGGSESSIPREVQLVFRQEGNTSPIDSRMGRSDSAGSLLSEVVSRGACQMEGGIRSALLERKHVSTGILRKSGLSLGVSSDSVGRGVRKAVSFGGDERGVKSVHQFERVDKKSRSKVWIPPEEQVSLRKLESDFRKITNFEGGAKTDRQKNVVREVISSIDEVEACLNVPESSRVGSHAEEDYIRMPRLLIDQMVHLIGTMNASDFVPSELNNQLASVDGAKDLLEQVQAKLKAVFPRKVKDNVFKVSAGQAAHTLKQIESCLNGLKEDERLLFPEGLTPNKVSHVVRVQASFLIGKIESLLESKGKGGGECGFKPSAEVPNLEMAKRQLESIQKALSKPYYHKPASVDDIALLQMRSARSDDSSSLDSASSAQSASSIQSVLTSDLVIMASAVNVVKKVEPCFLEAKDRITSAYDTEANVALQHKPLALLNHVDNLIEKVNGGELEFKKTRRVRSKEEAVRLLESVQENLKGVCEGKAGL